MKKCKAGPIRNNILIKTEAGEDIGLGHLRRMLALGQYLSIHLNQNVIIGINRNEICQGIIRKEEVGLEYEFIETEKEIIAYSDRRHLDILIIDVKNTNLYANLSGLKNKAGIRKIVSFDLALEVPSVDLYIVPSIQTGQTEKRYRRRDDIIFGLDAIFVDEAIDRIKILHNSRKNNKKVITVSFGGADPFNLTMRIVELLSTMDLGGDYRFQVLAGPFYKNRKGLLGLLKRSGLDFDLNSNANNTDDIARYFARSDSAIIGYGTSFYQFAYLGIPTLNIAIYKDDIGIIKKIERLGLGYYIGFRETIDKGKLSEKICSPKALSVDLRNNIDRIAAEIIR